MRTLVQVQRKWVVFSLVAVAVFMSTLDSSIVNLALPAVQSDFKAELTKIEWVPMIYLLIISSLLLFFGRLSDIKGWRWVYCRGFLIFTVGSLFCSTAQNLVWLIGARAFQGIGAAMLMACSPAIIVDTFPAAERGRALGMVGTLVAAGLTAGPALGGLIIGLFSWRVIFLINIPIGLVSIILAIRILEKKVTVTSPETFSDWFGAFLLMAGFSSMIVGLSHMGQWGITAPRTITLLLISLLALGMFLKNEKKEAYPLFDPSLLKIRLFVTANMAALIIFISLFTVVFLMPFYLVYPADFSIRKAGYIMVVPFIFLFFISPASGAISDRIGSRRLCMLGITVLTIALFLLSRLPAAATPVSIAWRLSLVGIGIGMFISPNNSAVMGSVPPTQRGVAAGAVATSRNLGMVIGIALAGLVFNFTFKKLSGGLSLKVYHTELEPVFMAAFRSTMYFGGIVSGLGIFVTFLRGPGK